MKISQRFARAAGISVTLLLLTLATAGLIPAAPAQAQGPVGIYTLELVPDQWYIIQRGADHARIMYSPPNPDPALISTGLDRPEVLINCSFKPKWEWQWGVEKIWTWLDDKGHARIEGIPTETFKLQLIDFGRGASDARQWVVTFPVEGNNGRVPNTCGP